MKRRSHAPPYVDVFAASRGWLAHFLRNNKPAPSTKSIHKLRTYTRKLEAIVATLPLGLPSGKSRKDDLKRKHLLHRLENVRRHAGKVRDMDVLTGDVLTLKLKGEKRCIVQLLEFLGAERMNRARDLHILIGKNEHKLRRSLHWYSEQLNRLCRREGSKSAPHSMRIITMKATSLSSNLCRPVQLSRANLHAFRLKVKELRDVLELSGIPIHPELQATLENAKESIGEWHDWEELLKMAKAATAHHRPCRLIQTIRKVSRTRYTLAMQSARTLRSKASNAASHLP